MSTCRNFATFSAGLCLSLAISNPSAAKAILQGGSLYREPAHWFASSSNSLSALSSLAAANGPERGLVQSANEGAGVAGGQKHVEQVRLVSSRSVFARRWRHRTLADLDAHPRDILA